MNKFWHRFDDKHSLWISKRFEISLIKHSLYLSSCKNLLWILFSLQILLEVHTNVLLSWNVLHDTERGQMLRILPYLAMLEAADARVGRPQIDSDGGLLLCHNCKIGWMTGLVWAVVSAEPEEWRTLTRPGTMMLGAGAGGEGVKYRLVDFLFRPASEGAVHKS